MDEDKLAKAHARLLEEIADQARITRAMTGRTCFSERVMAAMAKVPRHRFVRRQDIAVAYADRPQGIGHGQTISQPYMVALMTDLLDLGSDDRVLEIGTGSGYQAAVLAMLAGRVYSIEVIAELAQAAQRRLSRLGYGNVVVRCADGYAGWPEEASFDAVMVTAAPKEIPEALVAQLKPGGRMVVPTGRPHGPQTLYAGATDDRGRLDARTVLPVAFVPMVAQKS